MSKRFDRFRRAVRRPFEWLGIGLGVLVLSNLSRRGLLRVCDLVSRVMYAFDAKGRRHADANLRVMFGDSLSAAAKERIVRRSYRSMARSVGHAFWTCRKALERARSAGELSEECHGFLVANKPAVTVSGHIGCW